MRIWIARPGPLTTVQDLGRPGYGAFGVPPSGAMDAFALRAANRLAGNPDDAAGLEFTLGGPILRFDTDTVVAMTAGPFDATLDDRHIAFGAAVAVAAGSTLAIGSSRGAARGYLAVRGGIHTDLVMGSASTHVAARIGGRPLSEGDELLIGHSSASPLRRLLPGALPAYQRASVVRAMPGPHHRLFEPGSVRAFWGEAWTVGTRADRTGARLEGPVLRRLDSAEIDPEPIAPGTVQVPPDGAPIVLGADRPATGGYPKIATVITADLGRLSGARPGDTLHFVECTLKEARAALTEQERRLAEGIEEIA